MISDDEAHEALAMLHEFDAGLRASFDRMERQFATIDKGSSAMRDCAAWSHRLSDLKLAPGQELLTRQLMTLPKEAIALLQERYKELLGGQN